MGNIINVEMKARYEDHETIINILKDLGAVDHGIDHQVDTYFKNDNGRLKLRKGNIENSLIFYQRENIKGSKASKISLYRTSDAEGLQNVLLNVLEVKVVVDKKRHIFYIDNVKFHIDNVAELGSFIEIEAIDENGLIGESKLKEQCQYYIHKFGITDEMFISQSYSDLLLNR